VVYCSKDCQRSDWKDNHKERCIVKAAQHPQLGKEKRAAPLPPHSATSRFPAECLACPKLLPADLFDELKVRQKGTPAERDFQYWAGADPPWRDGGGGAVTDSATLAPEEAFKLEVEKDDARHASTEKLHARGVRVDWLLALTFALDLWEWKTSEVRGAPTPPLLLLLLLLPLFFFFSLFLSNTHSLSLSPFLLPALVSQVVKFLVKPATEFHGRCRFADLPFVQKFTGKATVFMSHCW
jgi:hypothetical protein